MRLRSARIKPLYTCINRKSPYIRAGRKVGRCKLKWKRLPPIFYDRRGNVVTPATQSIVKPRRGVFALALAARAVALVRQEFAKDIPELPGGGIEEDESADLAIQREWLEETGLIFDMEGPFGKEFQHVRGFYAEDKKEFWIYDQTFRLYHYKGEAVIGTVWRNPEGDQASWVDVKDLPNLSINRAHWCAIPFLLAQTNIGK